jgi:hypothetical protein
VRGRVVQDVVAGEAQRAHRRQVGQVPAQQWPGWRQLAPESARRTKIRKVSDTCRAKPRAGPGSPGLSLSGPCDAPARPASAPPRGAKPQEVSSPIDNEDDVPF